MLLNYFLTTLFIINGFFLAIYLEKKSFCTLGMISDILIFKGTKRFKEWFLTVLFGILILQFSISAINFNVDVNINQWNYLAKNTNSVGNVLLSIIGGFVFGLGMTLASGCGLKQLMRLGKMEFSVLLTLIFLSFGAFISKEYQFRENMTQLLLSSISSDFLGILTIKQSFIFEYLLGFHQSMPYSYLIFGILIVGLIKLLDVLKYKKYEIFLLGLLFSSFIILMYVAHLCGVLSEFSQNTKQAKIEGLSFVMPISLWFQYFIGKSQQISGAMLGILGILLGQFYILYKNKTVFFNFKNQMQKKIQTTIILKNIVGGFLMGIGGVIAMGCTIGQGVSALLMLAPSSLFVLLGLFAGVKVVLMIS